MNYYYFISLHMPLQVEAMVVMLLFILPKGTEYEHKLNF